MAVLNKTGITNGGTIQAEHVTRTIDALTGVSTDTVIATGSFLGTLNGSATSASYAATASIISVTDTTTGTGPYYVTFVDGATGVRTLRADSTSNALSFNATTNTLTTTASRAVSASNATTASYALNAGTSGRDYFTIQFKGNNFSGIGSVGVKYYPLITGDISATTSSAVILNKFISPIAATAASMSVSVYNSGAGSGETLRFSFQNLTTLATGTNVNLTFDGKSQQGIGPIGGIAVAAGDELSYGFLCASGTFPTGSYIDLSIVLYS